MLCTHKAAHTGLHALLWEDVLIWTGWERAARHSLHLQQEKSRPHQRPLHILQCSDGQRYVTLRCVFGVDQKLDCCIYFSCGLICSNTFDIAFADFEQLCRIKKIYAGGDQSFSHFTANVSLSVTYVLSAVLPVCLPVCFVDVDLSNVSVCPGEKNEWT